MMLIKKPVKIRGKLFTRHRVNPPVHKNSVRVTRKLRDFSGTMLSLKPLRLIIKRRGFRNPWEARARTDHRREKSTLFFPVPIQGISVVPAAPSHPRSLLAY